MAVCTNHDWIYFDTLRRVDKATTVLCLIFTTYNTKTDNEVDLKKEIAENLANAYNIFLPKKAGTYNGSLDQFASQYTIGHELGIWVNSKLELNSYAKKVAQYEITIKDYFDRVFLNYFQPVNKIIIHPLYNILSYLEKENKKQISKNEITELFTNLTAQVNISNDKKVEGTNSLFNMLLGTNYFCSREDNLVYTGTCSISSLIDKCNITYLNKSYEEVEKDLSKLEDYVSYLIQDNTTDSSLSSSAPFPSSSPEQIIYYGVPGSGKSYKIDQTINTEYPDKSKREEHTMRVVFHPEYTNADFVGQIMPSINKDGDVEYKFTPGPFAQILRRAYLNPKEKHFLIIEEINRGNAAAIFGDIFQLLDRLGSNETDGDYSTGWSKYSVNNDFINWYIRETVYKNDLSKIDTTNVSKVGDEKLKAIEIKSRHFSANTGIRLPPNLSLFATMNTSDQNVFTLDNAFQRRWDMVLVENKFLNQEEPTKKEIEAAERQASAKIEGTKYTWEQFHRCINSIISEKGNDYGLSSMEDKRLGCWFVKAENSEIKKSVFSNKVLKYLWDDAFKFCRQDIFESDIKDFEQLRNKFLQLGEKIFSDASGIRQKLESEEKDQTITNEANSQSTEQTTEISDSQE